MFDPADEYTKNDNVKMVMRKLMSDKSTDPFFDSRNFDEDIISKNESILCELQKKLDIDKNDYEDHIFEMRSQ